MVTERNISYKGSGSMTREKFLFPETRVAAQLISEEKLSDEEALAKICVENLFQFPTEREIKRVGTAVIRRLHILDSDVLVQMIAHGNTESAKQACLYAMMRQYRLVWDFMITVIGEKFREQDFSYSRMDVNVFFMRLQEQSEEVASWADSTVNRLKSVLVNLLVENEYIDKPRAKVLNPVLLDPEIENTIRANGDEAALAAFNCFE